MTRLLTVRTAKSSDIWPDGSGLSAEAEREIIAIARNEISADDVARSGLVFAEWYKYYYLAEGRWRRRQEQQAEQRQQEQVTESANARRIARLEKKLSQSIDRINANFKSLDEVVFGKPTDDPNDEPQIIKLIRAICWELMFAKRAMRDAGVWDEAKRYAPGAAVTYQGAIWTCQKEHEGERPPGDAWRLAVKSDLSELKSMVRDAVRDELRKQKGQ